MGFLVSGALFLVTLVSLIDVITRDQSQIRHLPKFGWILLIILLPLIGSALYWALGREYASQPSLPSRISKRASRAPYAPYAPAPPQDARTTEQQIADLEREIEQARLEQEIAKRRAAQQPPAGDTPPSGT